MAFGDEYKVQILYRSTGEPINDTFYDELGAKIWLSRIAKKHGCDERDLMLSENKIIKYG